MEVPSEGRWDCPSGALDFRFQEHSLVLRLQESGPWLVAPLPVSLLEGALRVFVEVLPVEEVGKSPHSPPVEEVEKSPHSLPVEWVVLGCLRVSKRSLVREFVFAVTEEWVVREFVFAVPEEWVALRVVPEELTIVKKGSRLFQAWPWPDSVLFSVVASRRDNQEFRPR
jgi:hypothetical protein